jgi:hypothetical protein
MAAKLTLPRPFVPFVPPPPPEIMALVDTDLEDDNTEPSGPPVVIAEALRPIAQSLPSQYELDSERKSSPPVLARRKELTKYVASAVGVAWFICTCAIGETALRSFIDSMR